MKIDIDSLRDTFKIGYEAFQDSRMEADELYDMYHNRHYTQEQLVVLANRGQPAETFNVVKLFARLLLGYYSTVVNTVKVSPAQMDDVQTAALLDDITTYTFRDNSFDSVGDEVKLDGMVAGLMCVYENVVPTGETDPYNRPIYRITLEHVPQHQIVLDPMSSLPDYSDAKYIHRFKWISKDDMIKMFGEKQVDKLDAYHNHLEIDEAEFEYSYGGQFTGYYKRFDNYLIVHSIMLDGKGKAWSCFWSGDQLLDKKEVTYKKVRFPYRIQKTHYSHKSEYYGIFREVKESQKAINQAILKIQLMVNTQKAFVEKNSVENINTFTTMFNRVNAVIPVKSLAGIKIENLTREVIDQYTIVDKALDRIQRVLSVNDSFLGMAYASDSGRKVKLQQNASIVALRYLTSKIENLYKMIGWDVLSLIQQYYTSYQVLRIADPYNGNKWIEINKPMQIWTGQQDETGKPIMRTLYEEALDPETGKPAKDDKGNLLIVPIPERETEIAFTKADVTVASVSYNDEDEKNQLMMETVISGPVGQAIYSMNPAGYLQMAAMSVRNTKTRYSDDIAKIIEQTAQIAQQVPQQPTDAGLGAAKQSSSLKVPAKEGGL